MSQILKASGAAGHHTVFGVGDQGVRWLGLDILRLAAGETWKGELKNEEAALVLLSGRATIRLSGHHEAVFEAVGGRADIFAGPPAAVYAPRNTKMEIIAETRLELAIAKAPCDKDLPAKSIQPGEVKVVSAGMANWRRDVRLIIPPGSPISQRVIVGETINPPGNWSGIPPHKHDTKSDSENILEEFYFFKLRPADGYGIQVVKDDGTETARVIHNDDVAVLQSGYHPTCAAPGVTVAYLWVLSGDSKAYDIVIDPRFSWVSAAEAVLREMAVR
ncbi:MAG TPA: 5-deoxy-glucuronate isomerase [Anaerolineales bacterium]|nr:5-deoxy-glucuronate isomerase [Anaerolineales bacterium]